MKNVTLFSSTKRPNICKRLWFLPFAKYMGKNIGKNISKYLSSKYSQNLIGHTKQSAADWIKTTSKERSKKQQKQPVI